MTRVCPSAEDLRFWLADGAVAPSADEVTHHVSACFTCQSLLDDLSNDAELRGWADRLQATGAIRNDATFDPTATGPDRSMPSRVGPYRLDRELGRGGMGIVYLAIDEALNRKVALKLMRRDALRSEARERFTREVRAAARIQHENVVGVYASGSTDDGSPYLAMEYVAGPTLADVIRERKQLPPRAAVELIVQIADGLAVAHAAGLVHRDVKPANILLGKGEGGRMKDEPDNGSDSVFILPPLSFLAKLADFGMVRDDTADSVLTAQGTIAGTPAYLSPEQALGELADVRSDVYGLGVTLYEMLTGEVPFRGAAHQVLLQVLDEEPRPPSQFDDTIPADVEIIVMKALAKEPAKRYPSANAFGADLRRWLRGEPIHARPVGRWERAWRWCRRNPRVAGLTGGIAALLLMLAIGATTAAVLIGNAYRRAEADRDIAVTAGQQSDADLEVALQAMTTLLDTVQAQMGHQPGLLPVKRTLLVAAADGLKKVVHRPDQTERVDRLIVKARERLGQLYLELGQADDARAEFHAGLATAKQLRQADPANLALGRHAALAHDQLGLMSSYAGDVPTALTHYTQAQEIRRELAAMHPGELMLQRDVAVSLGKIGDIHRLKGNYAEGLSAHTEAARLTEQLPIDHPSLGMHLCDLAFVHGRLFDTYLALNDLPAAERHGRGALRFAEERRKLEPAPGRSDVAYNLARLAQLAQRRGDVPAMLEHRRRVLQLRREVSASEPNSAALRRDVYLNQGFVGDALLFAEDLDGARVEYEESGVACAAELATDRGSLQKVMDLAVCYDRLTGLEARAGRYLKVADWYGKYIELARQYEDKPLAAHWKPAELRQRCETYRSTFEVADRLGLDDAKALAEQPAEYRPQLFLLRSWTLARKGRHQEAAAAADIAGAGSTNAQFIFLQACCYGLCVKAAEQENAMRQQYTDRAMAVLTDAISKDPMLVQLVPAHPDLVALRGHAAFQKLIGNK